QGHAVPAHVGLSQARDRGSAQGGEICVLLPSQQLDPSHCTRTSEMLLKSTFPALSKDEALRELIPCGGDGARISSSSIYGDSGNAPYLCVSHGHAAGWLSTLPSTTTTTTDTSTAPLTAPTGKSQRQQANSADNDASAGAPSVSSAADGEKAGRD
ncbi:unnamed protein product, partial [Scytosiphon promiscuus]